MSQPRSSRAARALILVGVLGFAAAVFGLWTGARLVSCWFYVAAWWSYILAADGIVHQKTGRSRLVSDPRGFALLATWSAFFWLVFEVVNLRLANWYYVGVPGTRVEQFVGAFVSFATVLPGVLGTADLLGAFGLFERARVRPWRVSPRLRAGLVATGVAFLVLPLAFPRHAYPLIWGATVLLVEPYLAARGRHGLLAALERGDPRPVLRLLAAGFVTGGLWESWNFHAEAKWIYTVPFFEESKLFEMPIPGFLGFPPFALECASFAALLTALGWLPEHEATPVRAGAEVEGAEGEGAARDGTAPDRTALERTARDAPANTTVSRFRPRAAFAAALVSVLACGPMIDAMLARTVRSAMAWVEDVPDITPAVVQALAAHDIETVRTWQRARARGVAPDLARVASPDEVARLERAIDLMSVKGLGRRGLDWLAALGVHDREALARADDADLLARCERLAAVPNAPVRPVPTGPEIRVWIRGARAALDDG